jgi:dihydrofolate synthase/folylpolyglutamate synthase
VKDYTQALETLFGLRRFGMELGLDRMERVLAGLGNPQRTYRVIHIAGTNGKGSTAAFAASLCRAAGLRTALYTSPHLSRFTERMQVDGVEIGEDDVAVRLREVQAVAHEAGESLTFFEVVTAMAFAHFRARKAEVAVVEVGLGGRLDATNVVDPAVAVVTGIALDHQEVLGGTLAAIAGEKAGIFKAGRPALFAAADGEAGGVLRRRAEEVGAEPILELGVELRPYDGPLGLLGPHQAGNAALALEAAQWVVPALSESSAAKALNATRWPGRLERIGSRGQPEIVLDCAHNPDGARALARALAAGDGRKPSERFVVVFGASADKDLDGICDAVAPLAAEVVVTEARSSRAATVDLLGALWRKHKPAVPVTQEPAIDRALDLACARAAELRCRVLVCGSIFLVGPVRERCLGERTDPLVVSDPNLPAHLPTA